MIVFIGVYGVIAFIVFMLFMSPVFQDWNDYSAKDVWRCFLFSLCVGLLWPVLAMLLLALAGCAAYYSRKSDNDDSDED